MSAADSLQAQRVDIEAPSPPSARRESDQAQSHQAREPASFTQSLVAKIKAWLADPSHESLAQRVAGTAFLIRIASAVLAYVSQIALARWMGTYEFGVFVYVWTWTLLIGGFADAGMAAAAQKFIPEYAERGALAHLRGFIVGSRWFAAGAATALALIAIAVVKLSEPILDTSAIVPLYIACFCLPIYALCSVQDGIARAYNSVGIGLMPTFILRPLVLLALMAGAHFSELGNDATTAIICSVVSVWLVGIVQTMLLQRTLKASVPIGERAYALREWLGMSLPIVMVIGFYVLLTYVDIIILQIFRPPEDVALYHAATKTLTLVSFVYFSVSAATAHRFSEYQSAGDNTRLQEFLSKATTLTFWPSVVVTGFVLLFGEILLKLFGSDFVSAYPLMFILAIGLLARASIGPSERLLIMVGQQNICAAVYGTAFAVNLVACFALVPHFGGSGAAVSTSLALLVETALLFFVVQNRLGLHSFVLPRLAFGTRRGNVIPAGDRVSTVPAQSPHAFKVEFRAPEELHDLKEEWRDLCARAVEPN
ncbi:MAG TPA: oligosaccharide flippase family protein, partial [Xanthobacteraceae bacterium]|nr:oligosaccharide flippase family protein [Xanthobacteraceae bacterium]